MSSVLAVGPAGGAIGGGGGGGGATTTSGTLAARPAAGNAGNLYFATDTPFIYRDTGSAWETYGLTEALSPPNDALFSWLNQGTSTTTSVPGGAVRLYSPSNGSADNFRGRVKALPATPYTITMGFQPLLILSGGKSVGMCVRESGTGKMIAHSIQVNTSGGAGTYVTQTLECNSPTGSFNAKATIQYVQGSVVWLRIADDGNNLTFWHGCDPYNWLLHYTEPRASFLLTGADQYGFLHNPWNSESLMNVVHLKEN